MEPILLIHGFGGARWEYLPIIRFLKKHGYEKFYEFNYKEKWGQLSVKELAGELEDFIKNNVKEKKINIIALSQGGIIARYYIENLNGKKVRKCITLCTPHHGSLTAYLSKRLGIVDLRPDSELIKGFRINKEIKTRYYCVYTPYDLMVMPGSSAKLEYAEKNAKVLAPLHPLAMWWPSTLKFILDSLRHS